MKGRGGVCERAAASQAFHFSSRSLGLDAANFARCAGILRVFAQFCGLHLDRRSPKPLSKLRPEMSITSFSHATRGLSYLDLACKNPFYPFRSDPAAGFARRFRGAEGQRIHPGSHWPDRVGVPDDDFRGQERPQPLGPGPDGGRPDQAPPQGKTSSPTRSTVLLLHRAETHDDPAAARAGGDSLWQHVFSGCRWSSRMSYRRSLRLCGVLARGLRHRARRLGRRIRNIPSWAACAPVRR